VRCIGGNFHAIAQRGVRERCPRARWSAKSSTFTTMPSISYGAAATIALVERGAGGLYHCVGTGHATWHAVALEIARVMGKEHEARLVPVSVADVALKAPRPQFAALSNGKLAAIVKMPTWQDALRRHLGPK
jgi:dTDP-4-dehydrorhamnose reductase